MPVSSNPKVNIQAALAKVAPEGLTKALTNPLQRRLRPGMKWVGALADTFEGPIPEVVSAFLEGVFRGDLARKWDDSAERPTEDRYAWARAILETGATKTQIFSGGTFQGREGAIKVESRWMTREGKDFAFMLEVEHPEGCQVSIQKDGRLVELRGREVVHLLWTLVRPRKSILKWYATHFTAMVQAIPRDRAVPSFGYDLSNTRDSLQVLQQGLVDYPSRRDEVWARTVISMLAARPQYFFPRAFVDKYAKQEIHQDLTWLLTPYGGVSYPTDTEKGRLEASLRSQGAITTQRGAKKPALADILESDPASPFMLLTAVGVLKGATGILTARDPKKPHAVRAVAIEFRRAALSHWLPELAHFALKTVPDQSTQIVADQLPEFPPLGKADALVLHEKGGNGRGAIARTSKQIETEPKAPTGPVPLNNNQSAVEPESALVAPITCEGGQTVVPDCHAVENATPKTIKDSEIRADQGVTNVCSNNAWMPEAALVATSEAASLGKKLIETVITLESQFLAAQKAVMAKEQEIQAIRNTLETTESLQVQLASQSINAIRSRDEEAEVLRRQISELEAKLLAAHESVETKEEEIKAIRESLNVAESLQAQFASQIIDDLRSRDQEKEVLRKQLSDMEAKLALLQNDFDKASNPGMAVADVAMESLHVVAEEDDSIIKLGGEASIRDLPREDLSAELVPAYFARIKVQTTMQEALSAYENWLLGKGSYEKNFRSTRVDKDGIEAAWGLSDLDSDKVDLQSEAGACITIRRSSQSSLVRYRHRDAKNPGTTWTNLARITDLGDGQSLVEHGVVRASEEGALRPGFIPVPRVVRDLLSRSVPSKPWEEFPDKPKSYNDANVAELVTQLLDPDRDIPLVVVSSRRGELLVDAEKMAREWVGLAAVHVDEMREPRALTQSLLEAGVGYEKLGCWDGSIRVYYPGFNPLSDFYDHPLFTKNQLAKWNGPESIRRIGRSIALRSIPQRAPRGFFALVERFDVEAAQAGLEGTTGNERVEALETQVRALQAALAQAESDLDAAFREIGEHRQSRLMQELFETENQRLVTENRMANEELGKVKIELQSARSQIATLSAAIEDASLVSREGLVPAECLMDLLTNKKNEIGTVVRMIKSMYPNRIQFLPRAEKGADSSDFKYPDQAAKMLMDLAKGYWDGLVAGGEDPGIRIFGAKGYSAKESANLTDDGRKARTFTLNGKRIFMEQHLKLGRGHSWVSDREILRIYFKWMPEERRILVGHIGEHLPL